MRKGKLVISSNFKLPLDACTQTFGILGKRGVGKTHAATVMAEEMLKASLHTSILDPIGVWWGLKSSADGKKPGFEIPVLGGDHGDLPLESSAGNLVADFVMRKRASVVLDLSLLSKNEQNQFVTEYLERLYRKNRAAHHVFLDEADAFAPQRIPPGHQRMFGAVDTLVRRGRARGLGCTLVTQRSAAINKDVLTQIECLLSFRTIAPHDRAALEAWVEAHGTKEERDQMMADLASLPVGMAWIWSPAWLEVFKKVQIRKRETFDSSATPKVGRVARAPKKLAQVDVEKFKEQLSSLVQQAESDDPRFLRRRISELELKLNQRQEPRVQEVIRKVPILLPRQEKAIRKLRKTMTGAVKLLAKVDQALEKILNLPSKPSPVETRKPEPISDPRPIQTNKPVQEGLTVGQSGDRRMLQVLARFFPLKITTSQLGFAAGVKSSSGTFSTYFSKLRKLGYIMQLGDLLTISSEGLAFLGEKPRTIPMTADERVSFWLNILGESSGPGKLFKAVLINPRITKEELGKSCGYAHTSGTFSTYLGTLRRNGLVQVNGENIKPGSAITG